jgi:hypothetical protein
MFMEQIFQNISKKMLETTYTLRLGQLLKITPDLKKYVAKTKAKKPNITTKVDALPTSFLNSDMSLK